MKRTTPLSLVIRAAVLWVALSLPFVVVYLALDPLRVLRWHEDMMPGGFIPNKGNLSAIQLEHQSALRDYNSFVLGSSISINFLIEDWEKHLPAGSRGFHFDASCMDLTQLEKGLRFIGRHCDIDNAVIVWCLDWSWKTVSDDVINDSTSIFYGVGPRYDDRALAPYVNHWKHFAHWWSGGCINGFVCDSLLHTRAKGRNWYPVYKDIVYDPVVNEERSPAKDDSLSALSDSFRLANPDFATTPKPLIRRKNEIDAAAMAALRRIAAFLEQHGTDYYFLLAPNPDGYLPSQRDDAFLREVFGERYIPVQQYLGNYTNNPYYFFDATHFRPEFARIIMDYIYQQPKDL